MLDVWKCAKSKLSWVEDVLSHAGMEWDSRNLKLATWDLKFEAWKCSKFKLRQVENVQRRAGVEWNSRNLKLATWDLKLETWNWKLENVPSLKLGQVENVQSRAGVEWNSWNLKLATFGLETGNLRLETGNLKMFQVALNQVVVFRSIIVCDHFACWAWSGPAPW